MDLRLDLGVARPPLATALLDGAATPEARLAQLCAAAAARRWPAPPAGFAQRLRDELLDIERRSAAACYLLLESQVRLLRRGGVSCTSRRGPLPGSLVAYLLGLTGVDPLALGLAPDRTSDAAPLPAFSLDLEPGQGTVVEDAVREVVGPSAILRVGVCERWSADAGLEPAARRFVASPDRVAIGPPDLDGLVPPGADSWLQATHFEAASLQALGFFLLELREDPGLGFVGAVVRDVRANHDRVLDLDALRLDCPRTYAVLGRGSSVARPPFDDPARNEILRCHQPGSFPALVAALSVDGSGANAAHRHADALQVYQAGWLRAHHAPEYFAAAMTATATSPDDTARLLDEGRERGLEVLSPDVNCSRLRCAAYGNRVRLGLDTIHGLDPRLRAAIDEARCRGRFTSVEDFCERVRFGPGRMRSATKLVDSGALDELCSSRERCLAALARDRRREPTPQSPRGVV